MSKRLALCAAAPIIGQKLDPIDVLGVLVAIEGGRHETKRRAVLERQRLTVELIRQQSVGIDIAPVDAGLVSIERHEPEVSSR
jgi:hypothetical protein